MIKKAIIPAAGLGTRLLPVTKVVAKELLPIAARPSIEYVVEEAVAAGITEVIFVLSPLKQGMVDYFNPKTDIDAMLADHSQYHILEYLYQQFSKIRFRVALQTEPRGLGHAIACARQFIDDGEDFMVLLPDDVIDTTPSLPLSTQMVALYQQTGKSVVALLEVPRHRVSSYGIAKGTSRGGGVYELEDLVEKPSVDAAPSQLAVVGRYILPAQIFEWLVGASAGAQGEIQLTDALTRLAHSGQLLGYTFSGRRFDVGVPAGLAMANLFYLKDDPEIQTLVRELSSQQKIPLTPFDKGGNF